MKTKIFLLVALAAALFISCNPDVQLGSDENIPEIAEHILGLPTQQAINYLASKGYVFGKKTEITNEYVFSRDPNISEFSYEASTMLMFGVFTGDTVKYASGVQRMKTEKSALDLYLKWSYYSAKVTMPKGTAWNGLLLLKQGPNNRYMDYYEGNENNKDKFWTDYKEQNAKDNIYSAFEHYKIPESTGHPKELDFSIFTNNEGNIQLEYDTQNFETHWELNKTESMWKN